MKKCSSCIWFEDCQKQKLCHQPCSYFDPTNDNSIQYQWNEMDYNVDKGEDITDTEEMIEWFRQAVEDYEYEVGGF